MELEFGNTLAPFGIMGGLKNTELTIAKSGFLTTKDFEFDTEADAVGTTKILEGIRDLKVFPILKIIKTEWKNQEAQIEEFPTGVTIFKSEAVRKAVYTVILPLYAHQILRNFSYADLNLIILDMNNKLMVTSPNGTKIKGFNLAFFRVGIQNWDGFVTELQCNFSDVEEWDSRGRILTPAWRASDLDGLTMIKITPSTVNQTTHVFTAKFEFEDETLVDSTGAKMSAPLRGLAAANLELIKTGTTTPCTIDSVVETATEGTYTITAHVGTFTSGTIQVKPVAAIESLFISDITAVAAAT